jgi:hypothetical protein
MLSKERQREASRKAQEEHRLRDERFNLQKQKKDKRKKQIITVSAVIFLLLGTWIVYGVISPGKYDGFAKCLSEKGVIMYGENWCQYTNAQKAMFGKSFKYINYEQKSDLKVRPTWVIDGKTYETVQSFERLSTLTGCKY